MKRRVSLVILFMLISQMLIGCTEKTSAPEISSTVIPAQTSIVSPETVDSLVFPAAVHSVISSHNQNSTSQELTQAHRSSSRLPADRWQEWPVVPVLSSNAARILAAAIDNPDLDTHTFSRVGDCQFTTATFLAGYAKGVYSIPEGYEETVHFYKESIVRDSITAANGLGINSVLNPLFAAGAGYTQCASNESPLDCELRTRHPAVVLVAMGTNWKPNAEITFEENLREVVDRILATGALPILATKADNIEGDWKINLAIAKVAYDYDIPLVNVWRSVQSLANHGLSEKNDEYLTGDAWMQRNDDWLKTLELVRQEFEP